MRIIANLTFEKFVNEFQEEFKTGLECPLKTVIADQAFKLGKTFPKDWGDKDKKWKKWLEDAGFDSKSYVVTSINSANMSEMARGRGDEDRARAVYYALHRNVENLDFALAVDDVMFGVRFLKNGKPVFEIAPDLVAPTAPFSHPQYHLYDSIKDKLRKSPKDGTWLDPHNHHSIPLSGRDAEQATLTQFMGAPEPFLILPLIAPSGAGKTRLISQWMRRYVPSASDTEWDAGFVDSTRQNSRDPQPWCDWEITRPTLIVIDYTFAYDAVVREIADRARRNPTQHKIRLLVIDHIYPKFLKDDFLWGKMFGSPGQLSLLERTVIRPSLELKPEIAGSKLLRDVIAAAASLSDKTFNADDPLIIEAEGHLTRMGEISGDETNGDPNAVRHPLFAALMGQAIREADGEAVDFSKWTRRDLITYYFSGENRLPWTVWDDGRGVSVGALVCAATLRRGLSIDTQIRRSFAKNADEIIDYAKRIVSSDNSFVIKPFLPDILGEALLLLFLRDLPKDSKVSNSRNDVDWKLEFIKLLSAHESLDEAKQIAANFLEVMARLVRNLTADDQSMDGQPIHIIREGWEALFWLLKPERFEVGSFLRLAVSMAAIDLVEQLRAFTVEDEASQGFELVEYFDGLSSEILARINTADFDIAITGDWSVNATSAFLQYYELCSSEVRETLNLYLGKVTRSYAAYSEDNEGAFLLAVRNRRVLAAKVILKNLSEEISSEEKEGTAALMYSGFNDDGEFIGWLLKNGAAVNQSTRELGRSALMTASSNGRQTVVERLLAAGENVNQIPIDDDRTALMLASQAGHSTVVDRLLVAGAEVNQSPKIDGGRTALMLASINGHAGIVDRLLAAGADVNHQQDNGWTALMAASESGFLGVVDGLLAMGANVNLSMTDGGRTALMLASGYDYATIVERLLEHDADINQADKQDGLTALIIASEVGCVSVVDCLLEGNAEVNLCTNDGRTALMAAADCGRKDVVTRLLKSKSINIEARSIAGLTAADYAQKEGHLGIMALIKAARNK